MSKAESLVPVASFGWTGWARLRGPAAGLAAVAKLACGVVAPEFAAATLGASASGEVCEPSAAAARDVAARAGVEGVAIGTEISAVDECCRPGEAISPSKESAAGLSSAGSAFGEPLPLAGTLHDVRSVSQLTAAVAVAGTVRAVASTTADDAPPCSGPDPRGVGISLAVSSISSPGAAPPSGVVFSVASPNAAAKVPVADLTDRPDASVVPTASAPWVWRLMRREDMVAFR